MGKNVILLRGWNTGGLKWKMEDLCREIELLGYGPVKAVLATGNLLLQSEEAPDKLAEIISQKLSSLVGAKIHCLARTESELEALLQEIKEEPLKDYNYMILFTNYPLFDELEELYAGFAHNDPERLVRTSSNDILWIVKKGSTLDGFGGKVLGKQKYKDKLTSRNIATVQKIVKQLKMM